MSRRVARFALSTLLFLDLPVLTAEFPSDDVGFGMVSWPALLAGAVASPRRVRRT
jgi:hypothetical protein